MKNKSAVALGKLNKGKKKRLSVEEIERRTKRLAEGRKKRWKPRDSGTDKAKA